MTEARISTKGQVVIPADVREGLGWKRGASINIQRTPHGVFIFKASKKPLHELRGVLKGFGITKRDIRRMRQEDELHDRAEIRAP